jgi:GGDEF domain-containing protein
VPMISIKRYLNRNDVEDTSRQVVALLIEKLGKCAVEGDPQELDDFRREIRARLDMLTPDLPSEDLLILAGSVTQSLETYNARISKTINRQGSDFQTIVKMLQDSLVKIAGENVESVQSLGRIGEQLERSAGFKDLQSLKVHLGSCLSDLREAIEREKAASKALVEKLRIEIERVREPAARSRVQEVDATTGLPHKMDCMEAIREAIARGTRHYVAVMVVNRVQPVNARFGMEAGDRMLARFKEHIEGQILESDKLFRWRGPAIIAILERPETLDSVRLMVSRMNKATINESLSLSGRSVLIPISAAWSVFQLSSTPEAIAKEIETFIASQGCRDLLGKPTS